jgi:hypothetical protein
MTASRVGSVPFAFLLALATEANGGAVAFTTDTANNLQPGTLSSLLNLNGTREFSVKSIEKMKNGEATTVVQYFPNFPNFRNCFGGNWRNC